MKNMSNIDQKKIFYSEGYKYQLREDYCVSTDIFPKEDIITEYIHLYKNGFLFIKKGYAWNGCSGPTYDDKTNMRPSLIHDAGYQLLRLGLLPKRYKKLFDYVFKKACIEDKMLTCRANYYYFAVDKFGGGSCAAGYEPYPVLTAP